MHFARYLLAYTVPVLLLVGLLVGGWWTYGAVLATFVAIPLLELVFRGTTFNLDPDDEKKTWNDRRFDFMVYSMVPVQYGLLAFYLVRMSSGTLTPVEMVGLTWSMGIACGALGINVAHELGHRRKASEQRMSKALLLTSLYMHFFIEHNRGHHTKVATEDDPASARFGEVLYAFWIRSVRDSYLDAWRLENERLERLGARPLSWDNEMVRFTVIQLAFVTGIGVAFGPVALGGFIVAAGLGALLLETVNYLEHYGLERLQQDDGRYQRVEPIHSWNSNHAIGRIMLFEVTRHSDHHANARRPYQVLRHFDDAPQLPTGYPGMMVLAFFPPLWRAVMHPLVERHRSRTGMPELPGEPVRAAA